MKKLSFIAILLFAIIITSFISTNVENIRSEDSRSNQPFNCLNTIYGISGGYSKLFIVNPADGSQSNQTALTAINAVGIAKFPNQMKGLISCIEPGQPPGTVCISGTSFYFVDLNPVGFGSVVKLGTTPFKYIEDIEADPITKYVYGIYMDQLVRVGSANFGGYGSNCPSATMPNILFLGSFSSHATGPFSLSFDYAGHCAIMSLNDKKRFYVKVPTNGSATPSNFQLILDSPISTVAYSLPSYPPFTYLGEIGACISGRTQFVGITGGGTNPIKAFYQWADISGNLNYLYKGSNSLVDYTSTPSNCITTIPK